MNSNNKTWPVLLRIGIFSTVTCAFPRAHRLGKHFETEIIVYLPDHIIYRMTLS